MQRGMSIRDRREDYSVELSKMEALQRQRVRYLQIEQNAKRDGKREHQSR